MQLASTLGWWFAQMKLEPNMLRLPAIGLNFDCISKRKGLKKQLNYIWVSILQVKSGYTPSSKYKWKYDIQELNIWGEWRSGVEEVGCWSYGVEEEGGGRGGSSGSDCPAYPHTGVLYGQLLILTQGLAPPSSCSTQPTRLRCTHITEGILIKSGEQIIPHFGLCNPS